MFDKYVSFGSNDWNVTNNTCRFYSLSKSKLLKNLQYHYSNIQQLFTIQQK